MSLLSLVKSHKLYKLFFVLKTTPFKTLVNTQFLKKVLR